ncbi:MAG: glycerate kinase, partial [Chloroflexota bacterium]
MNAAAVRTILIAPDSFKGSLTSVQVAQSLADGWRRARPDDEIVLCPLADGGEGTLAAIEAAGGWTSRTARVHDPLRRLIDARWLLSSDGSRAFVEMAQASGL